MHLPVDLHTYAIFALTMALMAITPGPAILYCIRNGLSKRPSSVFAGIAGLNFGNFIWFIAAVLGLQILVTEFPFVFRLITVAGGAYLGWLALKTFRQALILSKEGLNEISDDKASSVASMWQTFRSGFFVQILNPKAVLFFSAVLPPFVDIHRSVPPQMLVFALTTFTLDALAMTTYGLGAVRLSHLLGNPRNKQIFDIAVSMILFAIACVVIWHAVLSFLNLR